MNNTRCSSICSTIGDAVKTVEDKIFSMFSSVEDKKSINLSLFISALQKTGLSLNDPRLKQLNENIKNFQNEQLDVSSGFV